MKRLLPLLLVYLCVAGQHDWLNCNEFIEEDVASIIAKKDHWDLSAKILHLSMDDMAANTAKRTDEELTTLQKVEHLEDRVTILENDLFIERGKRSLK